MNLARVASLAIFLATGCGFSSVFDGQPSAEGNSAAGSATSADTLRGAARANDAGSDRAQVEEGAASGLPARSGSSGAGETRQPSSAGVARAEGDGLGTAGVDFWTTVEPLSLVPEGEFEVDVQWGGCDENARTTSEAREDGRRLLRALEAQDIDAFREIMAACPDVNLADSEGRSPLHLAAEWGELDVVEMLLKAGADHDMRGKSKRYKQKYVHDPQWDYWYRLEDMTPMHTAAFAGASQVIQVLHQHGANVMAKAVKIIEEDKISSITPLHLAAAQDSPAAVRALLKAGADIEARDEDGQTPLHSAARNDAVNTIRILLEAGANIESRRDGSFTPLLVAAVNYAPAAIRTLVEAGADVNARSKNNGNTPLHWAVFLDAPPVVVRALLEAGADVKARDNGGVTACDADKTGILRNRC